MDKHNVNDVVEWMVNDSFLNQNYGKHLKICKELLKIGKELEVWQILYYIVGGRTFSGIDEPYVKKMANCTKSLWYNTNQIQYQAKWDCDSNTLLSVKEWDKNGNLTKDNNFDTKKIKKDTLIYDFGGGENLTYEPEGDQKLIVVDILPQDKAEKYIEHMNGLKSDQYEYIQADLNKKMILKPGDVILLGQVVRYIDNIEQLAQNVNGALKKGGTVEISESNFDKNIHTKINDFVNILLDKFNFKGNNPLKNGYKKNNEVVIELTK
jgi:hypothetical protein